MASGVPASIYSSTSTPIRSGRVRRSVAPQFRVLAATVLILSSLISAAPVAAADPVAQGSISVPLARASVTAGRYRSPSPATGCRPTRPSNFSNARRNLAQEPATGSDTATTDGAGNFSKAISVSYAFSGWLCDTSASRACFVTFGYTVQATSDAFIPPTAAITFAGHVLGPCAIPEVPTMAVAIPDRGMSGPNYVGFNGSATHPNPQPVSATGTTDWKIWGATTTSLVSDQRRNGGRDISSLNRILPPSGTLPVRALGTLVTSVGAGPSKTPFNLTWSGGLPTPSGTATAGLQTDTTSTAYAGTPGYGFELQVPTDPCAQDLTLWVSAHHGTGKLTASIGSTSVSDVSVSGGQNHGAVYQIHFTGDGTYSQRMVVTWVLDSAVTSGLDSDGQPNTEGNVVIYAAALAPSTATAPAADFTISATPSSHGLTPGTSANSSINTTELNAPGVVSLSATVAPSTGAVRVLRRNHARRCPGRTLTVAAAANAAPGHYTVTVTGTEGSAVHATTVDVDVMSKENTPLLYRASPASPSTVRVRGVLWAAPNIAQKVSFFKSSSCTGVGAQLVEPTLISLTNESTQISVTPTGTGRAEVDATLSLTPGSGTTYIAAQVTPLPGQSNVGPCILVSDPNDTWTNAVTIGSNGSTTGYLDDYGRSRWYKFPIQPGGTVHVTLSGVGGGNMPADYDSFLFTDIAQGLHGGERRAEPDPVDRPVRRQSVVHREPELHWQSVVHRKSVLHRQPELHR